MTLIRELIEIPLQVDDGDFVLKLAEGVDDDHARTTVDDYVVTDGIVDSLDKALGLIAGAIEGNSSQATYLHGSFGSGKSHFMAILHLLLSRNEHALGKAELHPAYAKWDSQLADKKILLVPLHFLAAKSMDSEIFGQYVQHVQSLDENAALPSVYLSQLILSDELPQLREKVGEETFLDALNGDDDDDDWGDELSGAWTTETVDAALAAPATDKRSTGLTAAFIAAFRSSTPAEARATGAGYIDIDNGLSALSHHAKDHGYDAIVLFCDELILWLASKIGDLSFVHTETAKLTKLVEGSNHDRPVPIVSFVARQRDLNELVGEHVIGAELKALSDNLALQTGRFSTINLEDRDLAVIAKARVLDPVDAAAGTLLGGGADQALAGRSEIQQALAGSHADLELFRSVYPFTPALIETLIAVSEALQRERTALKVMLQMLVDHRETLELGEFLPVGDLWDVVSAKDEPFSAQLQDVFKRAKTLYRSKLRPMLYDEHGVDGSTAAGHPAFMRDDRILKTVLLGALVPQVDSFRNLSASKLVALNWGTVKSPIPGQEKTIVAGQLRRWATQLGELTVTDDPTDPVATIALINVDTDEILRNAVRDFDNLGERRKAIRNLVFKGLGQYAPPDGSIGEVSLVWRGTDRHVDMLFGNLRDSGDLADSALKGARTRPKVLIDFPFDDAGYGPAADQDRLNEFMAANEGTPTVCWLPSFFTDDGQRQLRNYVALDLLLTGERFEQNTSHLSQSQRREAKPLLTQQRNELESQLTDAVRAAYGIIGNHAYVDDSRSLTDHFVSLDPGISIQPTTAPNFEGAFAQIAHQLFSGLNPGHPNLGDKRITKGNRQTALAELQRALGDPDGRVVVDTPKRTVTKLLAEGLELGTLAESNLVISKIWQNRLDRHLHQAHEEGRSLTVGDLRGLIEAETGGPRGMLAEIADMIVAIVAAQCDHSVSHAGLAIVPDGGQTLPADAVLRREELPDAAAWTAARERAGALFGVTPSTLVSAPEVARFAETVKAKAASQAAAADDLYVQLQSAERSIGAIEAGPRFKTAAAARELVQTLGATKEPADVIEVLGSFESPTSDQATARSLSTAAENSVEMQRTMWDLIGIEESTVETARTALTKDEFTDPLIARLKAAGAEATRLASARAATVPSAPPAASVVEQTPISASASGASSPLIRRTITSGDQLDDVLGELRTAVEAGATVTIEWESTD